jgi:hypothetical protein
VARHREQPLDGPPELPAALVLMRAATAAVCAEATRDGERHRRRERLIARNPELGDRAARKQRRFAETMAELLRIQGASPAVASLAPQVALACYNAGHTDADGDPAALGPAVAAAFDRLGIPAP